MVGELTKERKGGVRLDSVALINFFSSFPRFFLCKIKGVMTSVLTTSVSPKLVASGYFELLQNSDMEQ